MKIDKTFNIFLLFIAVLMMLITAYRVNTVAMNSKASTEYTANISLTGSKLSDKIYAVINRVSDRQTGRYFNTQYRFTLYNQSSNTITNWKLLLKLPDDVFIESTTNVGFSQYADDNLFLLIPEFSYLSLAPNSETHFIVSIMSKDHYIPDAMHFSGYKVLSATDSIIGKIIVLNLIVWAISFVGYFVSKYNLRNYSQKQKNYAKLILASMNTFISFIDAKDPYTRGHSKRVAMYAAEIAKRKGLSENEIQNIYYAGLLHDAGKISIPDAVLNKPGKLTEEERKRIQEHTIAGGKMLRQLSSLRGIRETALFHHERYDGKGYPEGLRGESIPLYARIVGVADSYDAMSSNRVYRRHLNKDEIIEEIQKGSGTQFDPEIVKYMVDMINDGYVNVVKMETADNDDESKDFHITESDLPGANFN